MDPDSPRSSAWLAHRRWVVVYAGTIAQSLSVFLSLSQAGIKAEMTEPNPVSVEPDALLASVSVREIDIEDARAEIERALGHRA